MSNFDPNLNFNPFYGFDDDDDDEYERALEMGDRFFGSGRPRAPLSKAEQDKENFVLLNDNYGNFLDPESILAIFNQCGRNMDQTIVTIEEVISASTDVISEGGAAASENGDVTGSSESDVPCEFWASNGWCVRGCKHFHETYNYPCIYYDRKRRLCPGGKKCKFLHETPAEQEQRMKADEDGSGDYLFYEGMYNYSKLSKAFADFLKQIKANHDNVAGPLIDIVFDYIDTHGKEYAEVEQIVFRYFDNDERSGYLVPVWPSILAAVPEALKKRYEITESVMLIHREMRRMHIELGVMAHLRKQDEAAKYNMDCAMHYHKELNEIVECAYERLFCAPANKNTIKIFTDEDRKGSEYIVKCPGLALRVVSAEIFGVVPSSASSIYLYKPKPELKDALIKYLSGDGLGKHGYKSISYVESTTKSIMCIQFVY